MSKLDQLQNLPPTATRFLIYQLSKITISLFARRYLAVFIFSGSRYQGNTGPVATAYFMNVSSIFSQAGHLANSFQCSDIVQDAV